ncbi:RNA recognition motif domain [Trinorchestia longiramus]|nr:RNA recognition motif domain [Trinorchestia longiramus]
MLLVVVKGAQSTLNVQSKSDVTFDHGGDVNCQHGTPTFLTVSTRVTCAALVLQLKKSGYSWTQEGSCVLYDGVYPPPASTNDPIDQGPNSNHPANENPTNEPPTKEPPTNEPPTNESLNNAIYDVGLIGNGYNNIFNPHKTYNAQGWDYMTTSQMMYETTAPIQQNNSHPVPLPASTAAEVNGAICAFFKPVGRQFPGANPWTSCPDMMDRYPDRYTFPHPQNCSILYLCDEMGGENLLFCPPETPLYDAVAAECTAHTDVTCGSDWYEEDSTVLPGEAGNNSKDGEKKLKKRIPGIVYLSSVPYGLTIDGIVKIFSKFGEVRRVFFQNAEKENYIGGVSGGTYGRTKDKDKLRRNRRIIRYSEGWVEFLSKSKAKWVAAMLNNTIVGGKKKSIYHDCLWNIKYSSHLKWEMLARWRNQQRAMQQRQLANEVRQVAEETEQYIKADQVAERLEKKTGGLAAAGRVNSKAVAGIRQRLTEDEIVKKQQLKKLKDLNTYEVRKRHLNPDVLYITYIHNVSRVLDVFRVLDDACLLVPIFMPCLKGFVHVVAMPSQPPYITRLQRSALRTHNYTYTSHSHKKLDKYPTELSQARKQKYSAPSNAQIHMTPHTTTPSINSPLDSPL